MGASGFANGDSATATAERRERTDGDDRPIVAVSGASGLVGSALTPALESAGYRVLRLVRREPRNRDEVSWDPSAGRIDGDRLREAAAIVNLAGKSIASGRWTASVKRQIRDSRVQGTGLIAETIAGSGPRHPVLINASAIGYYGDRGDEPLDESSPPGEGFLAETTVAWEAATRPAAEAGARVVLLRFGMVLSGKGGALAKMLTPFKLGLGGRLGSGRQHVSFVSLDDVVGVILHAIDETRLAGPVNTVAPAPVTNGELTKVLGRQLGRPTLFPVPAPAIRLAFGEMGNELLLASSYVIPRRLESAGFEHRHPTLEDALSMALKEG